MRKIFVILLVLLLMLAFTGCKRENNSLTVEIENAHANKTENSHANDVYAQAGEPEQLSAEDKAVKAEIAKYSDTKVDFRHSKNVTIQGKNYDVVFEKFSSKINPSKIIYANDKGDSFEYDIETGKLCNIAIESNIVEKTNESIDMATAQKIASKYFPDDCNIDEYTVTKLMESKDGYAIWYTRYIGQYMTTDAFCIKIGFNGSIVYINDATDVFDGKSLDFNEDFVTAKIQEYINANEGVVIESAVILVDNNIICVDCVCNHTFDDGSITAFHMNIPLE